MGLQYRKAKVVLSYRENKPEMYKLRQITFPAVTFEQLVGECANSCGVNTMQTRAVIDALVNRLVHYMEIGHGVQMGKFGSFKPTFNSKVAQTLKATTIETLTVKKILFFPGKAFRTMLGDLAITSASETLSLSEEDMPDEDE